MSGCDSALTGVGFGGGTRVYSAYGRGRRRGCNLLLGGVVHTTLITLHAAAGIVCFAVGAYALLAATPTTPVFRIYGLSLLALVVLLAAAIAVDWRDLSTATRWIYSLLAVLGLYMLWRAGRAGVRLRRRPRGWRAGFVDDVGFTLISLFDGFVIVAAIDLNAPGWLVAVIAVLGVGCGIVAINKMKGRVAAKESPNDEKAGE
jgi:hypothetical protein